MTDFYRKFIEFCNTLGVTPSVAAVESGLSAAHASRWKRGSVPRPLTQVKLCDYFGVPRDYFEMNEHKVMSMRNTGTLDLCNQRERLIKEITSCCNKLNLSGLIVMEGFAEIALDNEKYLLPVTEE